MVVSRLSCQGATAHCVVSRGPSQGRRVVQTSLGPSILDLSVDQIEDSFVSPYPGSGVTLNT